MPRVLPPSSTLDIGARFVPAGGGLDVGGDFYDVFPVGSATAVVVGDVCGKGVEAAALTAEFRFTARSLSEPGRDPATVLDLVDAKVRQTHGADDRFCTAVYATLDRVDDVVRCEAASGGHPLPLVVRATGVVDEVPCAGSLLFAVPAPTHHTASFELAPGDALVLYTDGVTEARANDGSFFGERRLRDVLARHAGASAETIAAAVAHAALDFADGTARDDIAVLVAASRR